LQTTVGRCPVLLAAARRHEPLALTPLPAGPAPAGALRPGDVLQPMLRQLRALEAVFGRQTRYQLFSTSVLVTYEGEAAAAQEARVQLRLVDFAHVFSSSAASAEVLRPGVAAAGGEGQVDENFLRGLRGLVGCVEGCVVGASEAAAATACSGGALAA
jgi:hypothetical protein